MSVTFVLNGTTVRADLAPSTTLLDYLRVHRRLCGTKEGCAEGDCGACTVLVLDLDAQPVWRAVNSCILLLGQVHGLAVRTIEGISDPAQPLHPVQQAMIAQNGSQCGFCTPGIVLALVAQHGQGRLHGVDAIHDALAGNLCRCTGYRPIVDAARDAATEAAPWLEACACRDAALCSATVQRQVGAAGAGTPSVPDAAQADDPPDDRRFARPSTLNALLRMRAERPDARLVAGATDLGLIVAKRQGRLDEIICTRDVAELRQIEVNEQHVLIGAAVSLERLLPVVERHYPSFATILRRFGSSQIRSQATLGGNLGTASPIGDGAPCLIALGTEIELAGPAGTRRLPLEAFFLDYRKPDLRPCEVIARLRLPLPKPGDAFRAYKVAKRYDQDISCVLGAFRLRLDATGLIGDARIAFGGVAATPVRATTVEQRLIGRPWSLTTVREAAETARSCFTPLSDVRGTAGYRRSVLGNLLLRLWHDLDGQQVEVMAS